jgi:hypothetical protein
MQDQKGGHPSISNEICSNKKFRYQYILRSVISLFCRETFGMIRLQIYKWRCKMETFAFYNSVLGTHFLRRRMIVAKLIKLFIKGAKFFHLKFNVSCVIFVKAARVLVFRSSIS